MTNIQTRFSIGDSVLTLSGTKLVRFTIESINASLYRQVPSQELASMTNYTGSANGEIIVAREDQCFENKEEFINQL